MSVMADTAGDASIKSDEEVASNSALVTHRLTPPTYPSHIPAGSPLPFRPQPPPPSYDTAATAPRLFAVGDAPELVTASEVSNPYAVDPFSTTRLPPPSYDTATTEAQLASVEGTASSTLVSPHTISSATADRSFATIAQQRYSAPISIPSEVTREAGVVDTTMVGAGLQMSAAGTGAAEPSDAPKIPTAEETETAETQGGEATGLAMVQSEAGIAGDSDGDATDSRMASSTTERALFELSDEGSNGGRMRSGGNASDEGENFNDSPKKG